MTNHHHFNIRPAQVLLLALLSWVAVPAASAQAVVGVVGCSNTAIAVTGYHTVSDQGSLWDGDLAGYFGNAIIEWSNPNDSAWETFDRRLADNPGTSGVWFEICVKNSQPGSTATIDTIIDLIRQRIPNAVIYASALDDTPSCTAGDDAASQSYVDYLVDNNIAVRGPVMTPLTASQVGAGGCHANAAGQLVHGQDLADYFDNGTPPPPPGGGPFDDVPASDTFADDISWLADSGITKGCNPPANSLFCPNDTVTRGQMAAFLVRALHLPASTVDAFTDDDASVFQDDINALFASGITKGCSETEFCPNDPVTRGQMASFLVRGYHLASWSADLFVDDTGSVFEQDINALGHSGVTRGCNPPTNDRYCPTQTVTREQMAAFLHRASTL